MLSRSGWVEGMRKGYHVMLIILGSFELRKEETGCNVRFWWAVIRT